MALASAPSTPERASGPYLFRRSFTAPTKSSRTNATIREADPQGAETLYTHPAGKIVAFSVNPNKFTQRHSSVSDTRSDFQDEQAGSLPWASVTERTVAAGPLQFYRVLGSVAFLSSGTILQPVLAKSQCWCVDGVSKFVLRIRPHTYYRIELPHESRQDEEKVEELKRVLPKILQYEVTSCPFKRGFTVDLPEAPETPIQKKPWRPKFPVRSLTQPATEALDQLDELDEIPSKERYPEDIGVFHEPVSLETPLQLEKVSQGYTAQDQLIENDANILGIVQEGSQIDVSEHVEKINESEERRLEEPPNFKTPTRPKSLRTGRTVTAPPQLSLRTSPPSTAIIDAFPPPTLDGERELSVSSSIESFHSFHSPISPLPPSPPSPNTSPETWASVVAVPKTRRHKRDTSEATITASLPQRWDMADDKSGDESSYHSPPELPRTPTLPTESAWSEAVEQTPKQVRLRRARRRPRSPLPSSSNLYSPYSPGRNKFSGHHLTTAILQRTCSLLLGPPIQLIALMLRIAAKIAKGAFQGSAYGIGDQGQKIPCSWDFSDGSGDDEGTAADVEGEDEDDLEDDYGFSLGKTVSGKEVRARDDSGSWEID